MPRRIGSAMAAEGAGRCAGLWDSAGRNVAAVARAPVRRSVRRVNWFTKIVIGRNGSGVSEETQKPGVSVRYGIRTKRATAKANAGVLPLHFVQGQNDKSIGWRIRRRWATVLEGVLFGFLAQVDYLRVEEFCGEGASEGFYRGLLIRGERGEAFSGACQLGLTERFGILLQGDDGRNRVQRLQPLVVLLHFASDDVLCGRGFATAVGEVSSGDLL